MDAVLLTLEISAQDDRLLLREVLGLLQQAEVVDEVAVAGGLLLHGRHRRGRVGVARVDELRPGQGPSARPRPRQGLKIRVDLHQVWLLGRFRHGREVTEPSVTMSRKSDEPVAPSEAATSPLKCARTRDKCVREKQSSAWAQSLH